MKRSRFTEEQIIRIMREQEAGVSIADVRRKLNRLSALEPAEPIRRYELIGKPRTSR
jgi:hypothetical protein